MSPSSRGAVLTIDLDAIGANWRLLRDRLAGVPCAAVVKADAYGLGMTQVAPALAAAGCRTFFVAQLDEGVALRAVLPEAAIGVLAAPVAGFEADYAHHGLMPVLNSLPDVHAWAAFTRTHDAVPQAILQLDTGMCRLGLSSAEVEALAEHPDRLAGIRPAYVMSHLACADEPDHPQNREQLQSFREARMAFPHSRASFANSSGIFLGTEYHFDLARPGAALYGINPTPGKANPMRPVVTLQAKVLQVRSIEKGRAVGYGATYRAEAPKRIATVALGYADGFLRHLSGQGSAWYKGTRLPLAGRVSMDVTGLDVSALPPDSLGPGDLVELLGPDQGVDDLAKQAGTIGYEILTALGRRYYRIYRGG